MLRKIVAMLIMVVLMTACGGSSQQAEEPPFVYGLTLVPSGIDPHIHASAELGIPLRSVYDTLVYYDTETDTFVPGLAASWTVENLTYTFQLREDVTFHDGTPFNAEAVKVNLERILNEENNSAKARDLLGPVESVEVTGPYTVVIRMSAPFPALLDGLAQPYIGMASPQALAEWNTLTYQFHQVGTGPYRFVEYVVNEEMVLERNPDYAWAPDVLSTTGVPDVERIVFRFFPDPGSRVLALESGDVQVMGEMLPTDARQLQIGTDYTIEQVPIPGQPQQYLINTQQFPTDRPTVREALILATDRQAIAQTVFQGYRPIAFGPLSKVTLYYDPTIDGRYAFNPTEATSLMDSTGLLDSDEDGWRDNEGEPVVITLVTPPWGQMPDVAVLIEQQWEENLAVQVEIQQVPSFPALVEAAEAGDYNLIGLNFFGYDPVLLNTFYTRDGRLNWSNYTEGDLHDKLLAAQSETDPNARRELYGLIQQQIMDEVLVLPITDYVNLNGVEPGVNGLHYDAQGWFPYLADVTYGP